MYAIKNEFLTVVINEIGATLWSVKDKAGQEYLWQGDPKYWADRAPNIFPYVARLTEGKYTLQGNTYKMDIHGFAKDMMFQAKQISDSSIVFSISDTEDTYKQYPYKFRFSIGYRLSESTLTITYHVKNDDDKLMYFGLGGHPGFNVPFDDHSCFEDYYLEFDAVKEAKRVGFSEDCFITGKDELYPLEDGKRLWLEHPMFDDDAIVLRDMDKSVLLASKKSDRAIRVTYPQLSYLGIWHMPKTDAPYVCIEPWSSLPSRKGVIEDLATQPSLLSLDAKGEYSTEYSIELIQERLTIKSQV